MLDEIRLTKKDIALLVALTIGLIAAFVTASYYHSGNIPAVTEIHKEAHEAAADVKAIVEDAFRKEAENRDKIEADIGHFGGASVADSINKLIREHREPERGIIRP